MLSYTSVSLNESSSHHQDGDVPSLLYGEGVAVVVIG